MVFNSASPLLSAPALQANGDRWARAFGFPSDGEDRRCGYRPALCRTNEDCLSQGQTLRVAANSRSRLFQFAELETA